MTMTRAAVFAALLVAALHVGTGAQAQNIDKSPQAQKQVDAQLTSIMAGLTKTVGARLGDGSVLRSAELDGRIIRMRFQMPYTKYDGRARTDFIDRRRMMQKEFCSGNTAKLIPYGVGWDYEFVDVNGAIFQSFQIKDCES